MLAGIMASAGTFRIAQTEKVLFVGLSVFDMIVTVMAVSNGYTEMNPLVRTMLYSPVQLLLIKLVIPVFIAWAAPGKFLIPASLFLLCAGAWNISQLIIGLN